MRVALVTKGGDRRALRGREDERRAGRDESARARIPAWQAGGQGRRPRTRPWSTHRVEGADVAEVGKLPDAHAAIIPTREEELGEGLDSQTLDSPSMQVGGADGGAPMARLQVELVDGAVLASQDAKVAAAARVRARVCAREEGMRLATGG